MGENQGRGRGDKQHNRAARRNAAAINTEAAQESGGQHKPMTQVSSNRAG